MRPNRLQRPARAFRSALVVTGAALALAACSMVPAFERPAVEMPAAWDGPVTNPVTRATPAPEPAAVGAAWWSRFGSPELDRLMAEALAANQDLAAALQRIEQARAAARIAGAGLLPTVDASGTVSRDGRGAGGSWDAETGDQAQLVASYEIDLWGRNRAAVESAAAGLASSSYDRDALALVVQAELASGYATALALKDRLAIARSNLDLARELLSLVEAQYREGRSSALELAQQRLTVATQEAAIPELERQLRAAEAAIAVLAGRPPQGFRVESASLSALSLPAIAAGRPADLLARRPDIRRAESDLRAANADIGAARAAFYPTVDLSISAALSGLLTGGVTTTAAALAGGVAAPIFSGGALEGQLEQAQARHGELVAGYRQTVLTALQETEDALVAVDATARRSERLADAAAQARDAYRLSQLRYVAGAVDFLSVIDAQRSQLSAEDGLIQAELARYSAAVDLYAALGGGWTGG